VKHTTQDQFNEIVVNGRTNVSAASTSVMPPFGEVEDVVTYLDDIWAYLSARRWRLGARSPAADRRLG